MALLTALLIAALLPTVNAICHLNNTMYMVAATSQMTEGSSETVCVHVYHLTEIATLSVSLSVGSVNVTLLTQMISMDFYQCVSFTVPTVSKHTLAILQVTLKGETDLIVEESKILIIPSASITIIQSDKPIYKPGQTVKFRIVTLDVGFLPINEIYKIVELQDPNSNRIAQWLDLTPVSGIVDLSHPMDPEAAQGNYIITAWNKDGEPTSYTFEIKEYVLPKFEVIIKLPDVIVILDTEIKFKVCGKYTYGKPVIGLANATLCRPAYRFFKGIQPLTDICQTYELETDHSGCATQKVKVNYFAPTITMYQDVFTVSVELKEIGTGIILRANAETYFTDVIRTVVFVEYPTSYRPGLPFMNEVIVTGPGSTVIANEVIILKVESFSHVIETLILVTDQQGKAPFSLDTSKWNETVTILAQFKQNIIPIGGVSVVRGPSYNEASLTVSPFYSSGKSFLKITHVDLPLSCRGEATVTAKYIIHGLELNRGQRILSFYYMVVSKGRVVQHGGNKVAVKFGIDNTGSVTLSLTSLIHLAPVAQVVVYALLPSEQIVADSMDFPVDLCLQNNVSLSFSPKKSLPGDNTTVNLQAYPGSLCSLRAIDLSVLLLKKEQELSVGSVYGLLPVQTLDTFPIEVEENEPYPCLSGKGIVLRRPMSKGGKAFYFPTSDENDIFNVFKSVGLKILTNLEVKKTHDCNAEPILYYAKGGVVATGTSPAVKGAKGPVRSFFPETWIWDLVPVGPTGSVSVDKKVPDTITTWAAGAFCTSPDVGLGLAVQVDFITFQPFFVSLTMPYSVIRGETFTLIATVFNYLPTCIMVKVTLADSVDFTVSGTVSSVCVCGDESVSFTWTIQPVSLGEISFKVTAEALNTNKRCNGQVATFPVMGSSDTVIQTLLVEPEGTQVTIVFNALLLPPDGPLDATFTLELPPIYVHGSEKAFVSVVGDVMGRAIKNLDKLLSMPTGCGEQNMMGFAPDIFILNYLLNSGQLTKTILDTATLYLESGYQRELIYKLDDGSYSAFGKSDRIGNTWLTAFVMKSFGGARPFIYVDPLRITEARAWLLKQQRMDGCFNSVGRLIHTELQGGVHGNFTLSAYISAALLELKPADISDPQVQKSLICLKAALPGLVDTYNFALLFYTFTLAGDQETRIKLITILNDRVNTQGGSRHWDRPNAPTGGVDSLEVEMTAYVLLALLSGPTLPGFGLEYSASIVFWLVKQQNPYGGFASTQDTVVALQALAKYGAVTYRPNCETVLSVSSKCKLNTQYHVNQRNRLLYQTDRLLDIPGIYYISAEGSCDVFVQVTLQYNIPPLPVYPAFMISLKRAAVCNAHPLQVTVAIGFRYTGIRNITNMVIINFKLLSGFDVDAKSLRQDSKVKKVEVDSSYVNIYLDPLNKNDWQYLNVITMQDKKVGNLKPAVVKIYDYYQPREQGVAEYTSPCV